MKDPSRQNTNGVKTFRKEFINKYFCYSITSFRHFEESFFSHKKSVIDRVVIKQILKLQT